jgi:serine/threonine-protein kinase
MREVGVGETLDQYKLVDVIARSGMASIFKASDLVNGANVVIKIPYQQFESDVVFYDRFKREEEVGRRLDHPNIVKVLTPRRKSRMYMAMEFVEGVSLRALMRENGGKLPPDKALDIARQICRALVYMHGERVVHRDLKPENILVTANGDVKIMDFGIALDESARRLTWSGLSTTVGTPDYMAPEQVQGRRGDVRTDIYALGTILYEMLVGPTATRSHRAVTFHQSIRTSRRSCCTLSSGALHCATRAPKRCSRISSTRSRCRSLVAHSGCIRSA